VLLDYSRSHLESARQRLGDDGFLYVAADLYRMPFAPGVFDGATLIRVLHHVEDPLATLKGLRFVIRRGGIFLLEFANKRNLKAILRWLVRKQTWNPFAPEPVEFVDLNYDFHPRTIRQQLSEAGFKAGRTLAVSHFRIGLVKRLVPTGILVFLDSLAQFTGMLWQLTPSVFIRNEAVGDDVSAPAGAFWRCPACGGYDLIERPDRLVCRNCHTEWSIVNGVYDFKQPRDQ
jgi:SAM-dependent methyltransferase